MEVWPGLAWRGVEWWVAGRSAAYEVYFDARAGLLLAQVGL